MARRSQAPVVLVFVLIEVLHVRRIIFLFGLLVFGVSQLLPLNRLLAQQDEWLQWRGPTGDNHAAESAEPPIDWDLKQKKGLVWRTPIHGSGHSSPTVLRDAVYVTAADARRDKQWLLKLDRNTGDLVQRVVVHDQGLPTRIHPNNTHASPTVASDGERLFVVFYNDSAIRLSVYNTNLRKVWQRKVADFQPASFQFGYGASPTLYKNLVIVAAEYDGEASGLYAFRQRDGKPIWKQPRPANLSFSSPIVAKIAGRDQLLISGADQLASFDPTTGRPLWAADATTEATCGTVVWDDRTVFASGGNPVGGTWAVLADGSQTNLWENRVMCYEQSLLADRGYIYAVADAGVAYCWKANSGTVMWRTRLGGGFSSSPLLADGRIYVASEAGEVFVFRATPDRFVLLAENRLGDEVFATPVALGDRLYVRYAAMEDGKRQEYVAALGGP